MPAVTFSVNHDIYPKVGKTLKNGFYSRSQHPDDDFDKAQSHLAIAYLCAKRDGSPLILRFEDERDNKKLIQRALAFRVLMEEKNAPHEYIVKLADDVFLIARQFGFVVINRGTTHSYRLNQAIIRDNFIPSGYIPDGSYDDLIDLGTEREGNYQLSNLNIEVRPMDAKFLVLSKPTYEQKSYDIVFKAVCGATQPTDQVCVAGSHPVLGNWWVRFDLLNGMSCSQSASNLGGLFPNWQSRPLRFPAGTGFNYRFAISNIGGVANTGVIRQWEKGGERHYMVIGDATVPENPPAAW